MAAKTVKQPAKNVSAGLVKGKAKNTAAKTTPPDKKETGKKSSKTVKTKPKETMKKDIEEKKTVKPKTVKAAKSEKEEAPAKKTTGTAAASKTGSAAKADHKTPAKPEQKPAAGEVNEVEITSPKKNVRKIRGYSKEDLDYFRQIILDKRNEIIEQLQNLREQMMDPTTGQYVNESSPYSLHMAEQGTDAMEREKIFLWAQRENKFLGYLDDALHRIENGTYGICIDCIDEPQHLCPTCPLIPKERLAAVPHSQLCLPVKQKQEKK